MATIGIDYADVDGNKPPSFSQARTKSGVRFAIMRAVYGRPWPSQAGKRPYVDECAVRDHQAARNAGITVGLYGFFCPPLAGVYTPTPVEQGQAMIDAIGPIIKKGVDFTPFLDVEQSSNVIGPAEYVQQVLVVVEMLTKAFGASPGIYWSNRVVNEVLGGKDIPELKDCPKWIAKPWPLPVRSVVDLAGAPSFRPTLPVGDKQWMLYQYQGDALRVAGFTSTTDMNRINEFGVGATGDHVAWLQRKLAKAGCFDTLSSDPFRSPPPNPVDGIFGAGTKAALMRFQRAQGCRLVDGIVGLESWPRLCWV